MLCFGFSELDHLGVICRQIMAIGKIHIVAFAGGVMQVFGKVFWSKWL
jgi:hypothetical protein